ncbi:GNAT family N-acetyltransferase [Ferviditalea candida]|uniref:GNAT family N-acetyltransferase n=1 Tax=Ferviditalea candida TaxID=3108399 RepID=A0ABU5ZN66_9BACL|nr:GNAT family N-acetyltransferase [Paenibacillaceae bacterium T2]
MIRIRRRKPALDDKRIISLIKNQLYTLTLKAFPDLKFDDKQVKKRLKDGVTFVVVKRPGPAKGFITFVVKDGVLYLDMLAVHPSLQGKGWGTKLMRRAENYGIRRGCKYSTLYVDELNVRAQTLYKRLGYQEYRFEDTIKCYLYFKELPAKKKRS